ncbi:MAG: hypothetical protein GY754_41425 [bacterium]|nr:hypothetical protein [bacterium]
MKTFVDLTTDMIKEPTLASECLAKINENGSEDLSHWFQEKGYDIPEDECGKLINNRDSIRKTVEVGVY